mgnify:FL=1
MIYIINNEPHPELAPPIIRNFINHLNTGTLDEIALTNELFEILAENVDAIVFNKTWLDWITIQLSFIDKHKAIKANALWTFLDHLCLCFKQTPIETLLCIKILHKHKIFAEFITIPNSQFSFYFKHHLCSIIKKAILQFPDQVYELFNQSQFCENINLTYDEQVNANNSWDFLGNFLCNKPWNTPEILDNILTLTCSSSVNYGLMVKDLSAWENPIHLFFFGYRAEFFRKIASTPVNFLQNHPTSHAKAFELFHEYAISEYSFSLGNEEY